MARHLRLEYEGAIYHITARGNERRAATLGEPDVASTVGEVDPDSMSVFIIKGLTPMTLGCLL